MVFEILGVNLLEIMKRYEYKGIPIPIVRRIAS
jgi:serine/threonine-protein kinase SRPK3